MDAKRDTGLECSRANRTTRKVAVIGLDGAAWKTIDALIQKGELRNLREMTEKGVYGGLKSTIPPLTGPSWVSFATGKNPGKHGIFDFFLVGDSLTERRYISTEDVSADMFYQILERQGKRCIIVNLPCSSPPRIRGIVIDSFTAKGENYIFPTDLAKSIPMLQKYRIVPEGVAIQKLAEFREIERIRFDCARELLKTDWDFFFVLFLISDAVQHRFYEQILDGTLTDSEAANAWKDLDEYIGWFMNNLPRETTVLVMSDHGFASAKKNFDVNRWLIESGYLKAKPTKNPSTEQGWALQIPDFLLGHPKILRAVSLPYGLLRRVADIKPVVQNIDPDLSQSVAYAMGTMSGPAGGIFINACDRFRHGIVESRDYEELRTKLVHDLENLKDGSGRPVLRYVMRKEDAYWGTCLDRAPDILIGSDEYQITEGGILPVSAWRRDRNMHAREGILIACGPDLNQGLKIEGATIYDIAPTILHIFGLPMPKDMDGRVLKEIFANSTEIADNFAND